MPGGETGGLYKIRDYDVLYSGRYRTSLLSTECTCVRDPGLLPIVLTNVAEFENCASVCRHDKLSCLI